MSDLGWHVLRVEGPWGLSFITSRTPEWAYALACESVTIAHPPPLDEYAARNLAVAYTRRADDIARADESFDPSEEDDGEL